MLACSSFKTPSLPKKVNWLFDILDIVVIALSHLEPCSITHCRLKMAVVKGLRTPKTESKISSLTPPLGGPVAAVGEGPTLTPTDSTDWGVVRIVWFVRLMCEGAQTELGANGIIYIKDPFCSKGGSAPASNRSRFPQTGEGYPGHIDQR